jgi:hypothetical protein
MRLCLSSVDDSILITEVVPIYSCQLGTSSSSSSSSAMNDSTIIAIVNFGLFIIKILIYTDHGYLLL